MSSLHEDMRPELVMVITGLERLEGQSPRL